MGSGGHPANGTVPGVTGSCGSGHLGVVLRRWVLEVLVLGGMWVCMCVPACTGCARSLCAQDSQYVVAVRNYSPEDGDQLSFHKGDIIHLQPLECPERGEQPPPTALHAEKPSMRGTVAAGLMASPAPEVAVPWPCIL